MSWFSKLVTVPIKIINIPLRSVDTGIDTITSDKKKDLSTPLDQLAESIEDFIDDDLGVY